jgi:Smg protein
MEILVYLMSNLSTKELVEINMTLEDQGYTQSEISAAFDWLHSNIQLDSSWIAPNISPGSRRHFLSVEKKVISAEARGYLMQLCELGLLSATDLETVIEKAMGTGLEQLSVAEMKSLTALILSAKSMQPGSGDSMQRFLMNNNETIH